MVRLRAGAAELSYARGGVGGGELRESDLERISY